jgi:hypothetical protein
MPSKLVLRYYKEELPFLFIPDICYYVLQLEIGSVASIASICNFNMQYTMIHLYPKVFGYTQYVFLPSLMPFSIIPCPLNQQGLHQGDGTKRWNKP